MRVQNIYEVYVGDAEQTRRQCLQLFKCICEGGGEDKRSFSMVDLKGVINPLHWTRPPRHLYSRASAITYIDREL